MSIQEKFEEEMLDICEKYYKLEPIENTAPTLEIDGIRMHRTKHMTPLEDARRKVETAGVSDLQSREERHQISGRR